MGIITGRSRRTGCACVGARLSLGGGAQLPTRRCGRHRRRGWPRSKTHSAAGGSARARSGRSRRYRRRDAFLPRMSPPGSAARVARQEKERYDKWSYGRGQHQSDHNCRRQQRLERQPERNAHDVARDLEQEEVPAAEGASGGFIDRTVRTLAFGRHAAKSSGSIVNVISRSKYAPRVSHAPHRGPRATHASGCRARSCCFDAEARGLAAPTVGTRLAGFSEVIRCGRGSTVVVLAALVAIPPDARTFSKWRTSSRWAWHGRIPSTGTASPVPPESQTADSSLAGSPASYSGARPWRFGHTAAS